MLKRLINLLFKPPTFATVKEVHYSEVTGWDYSAKLFKKIPPLLRELGLKDILTPRVLQDHIVSLYYPNIDVLLEDFDKLNNAMSGSLEKSETVYLDNLTHKYNTQISTDIDKWMENKKGRELSVEFCLSTLINRIEISSNCLEQFEYYNSDLHAYYSRKGRLIYDDVLNILSSLFEH